MRWCLGFAFQGPSVLLIQKSQTMHIGLWNGLGGKIERGESAAGAMRREFKEEAGFEHNDWIFSGGFIGRGRDWYVAVYAARLEESRQLHTITANFQHKVGADYAVAVPLDELSGFKLAPHTRTMIYMALDKLENPHYPELEIQEM